MIDGGVDETSPYGRTVLNVGEAWNLSIGRPARYAEAMVRMGCVNLKEDDPRRERVKDFWFEIASSFDSKGSLNGDNGVYARRNRFGAEVKGGKGLNNTDMRMMFDKVMHSVFYGQRMGSRLKLANGETETTYRDLESGDPDSVDDTRKQVTELVVEYIGEDGKRTGTRVELKGNKMQIFQDDHLVLTFEKSSSGNGNKVNGSTVAIVPVDTERGNRVEVIGSKDLFGFIKEGILWSNVHAATWGYGFFGSGRQKQEPTSNFLPAKSGVSAD